MRVYEDIYADDLVKHLWGQGRRNYDLLEEMGASPDDIYDALLEILAEGDEEKPIDMTLVNDTIWHDFDLVKECIRPED